MSVLLQKTTLINIGHCEEKDMQLDGQFIQSSTMFIMVSLSSLHVIQNYNLAITT